MAKLPEKFEDWTRPWDKDDFDEEKAARGIFTALRKAEQYKTARDEAVTERSELESKLAAAEAKISAKPGEESAKDAKITELTAKLSELEKNGRPADRDLLQRLEVAIDHGLTKKDARRLVGDTPEDLAEDAAELAERLGRAKSDDGEQGKDGEQGNPPAERSVRRGTDYGDGRDRGQGKVKVLSADELLAEDAKTPDVNNGLNLTFTR